MSEASKISKSLGYDNYIALFFRILEVEHDNMLVNFKKENISEKNNKNNFIHQMNKFINTSRFEHIKLLYIDIREIDKNNNYAMINFAKNNQQIETVIYTCRPSNFERYILNIPFKNLKYLYIKNNHLFGYNYIDYADIIKYHKNLRYLHIDNVSSKTCDIIKNRSKLKVLILDMVMYFMRSHSNDLQIIKNAICPEIIINQIHLKYSLGKTELKNFMIKIINIIIENKFFNKVIIKGTMIDFILDGNLLRKIESSQLTYFQIDKIKIFVKEKFLIKDFFDINLIF